MADLHRIRLAWDGWSGAPGVSTMYTAELPTTAALAKIHDSLLPLAGYLPEGLTIQVEGTGDVIEDTTGAIVAFWNVATVPAAISGSSGGTYAAAAGAVMEWLSTDVVAGRRVQGKTFIVPLVGAFDGDGTLSSAALAVLRTAANSLANGVDFTMALWSRPRPLTGLLGASHEVVSARVPDLAAVLRSRR